MVDLQMRRFNLKNDTFVFYDSAKQEYVNITSSFTFTSSQQLTTSQIMCSDYQRSVVDGTCAEVPNLILRENSQFEIALTDPFQDTPLTVGFYFCIKPTAQFQFFSLVGQNGDAISFHTNDTGHLSLQTTTIHDLGVNITMGVWTYAIFSTDLTVGTGTREIELYLGTQVHQTLSGSQYTTTSFEKVVMRGGYSSFSNLVIQNSLFTDYAEAKRMLKYRPMYTEYDRSIGKVPSIYYLDGSDLFVGATKLLDQGQLKYTSVLRLGEVQMMTYHPFIPSFSFEQGKEQSAETMSEESTGRGFVFTNFNTQGATITHSLQIPPFSLDFGTWAFQVWIKLHFVINPPLTIFYFDTNNTLLFNFTGGYQLQQSSGSLVLSFGDSVPSLKEWNHIAVSSKDGTQNSFLNCKKQKQLINPDFSIFNNTNVTKTLNLTLADQSSYSLAELRFWYIERSAIEFEKYKQLELLTSTYGLFLYYPLRNFDISDRMREYNKLTASSGQSRDYFTMEDLQIYSRANTVFQLSESGQFAKLPISSGQHTMEGFTIKGWINLKILSYGEKGIDKYSSFLSIYPYVTIRLLDTYQLKVVFSMYDSHVTQNQILALTADISFEQWVAIAIVQDEPNSLAEIFTPAYKKMSFSNRNPTLPLTPDLVRFSFTSQKGDVFWTLLCRYFMVYSFAQDNPLYSIDSRQQFGALVYLDIEDIDPDNWIVLDATNSEELQCNQISTIGTDVCQEREKAFTMHQNCIFALSPQKQRGSVGQFSFYFQFKLHNSTNSASSKFLSLEGVYEIYLNDDKVELSLLTQTKQNLSQNTSVTDQWVYAFISRVSEQNSFIPWLGFLGENPQSGPSSAQLLTLPTYLRAQCKAGIKSLSIRNIRFWAFGLEALTFDSMFRRSFPPTLLSPYLVMTYNFDDRQGTIIRLGRHLQIFNNYPGLSWSDGSQYKEYQRCYWSQTPWPQNLCGTRNKVLSVEKAVTLSLNVQPLQDLSFLLWINIQSGSSGYILGDNQIGIRFISSGSIVQIAGNQRAALNYALQKMKWINIRLTNSKALGLLFYSAESNYTLTAYHDPPSSSLTSMNLGAPSATVYWHSFTIITGPLLPIDFNGNPFYKFQAFLSYTVKVVQNFDFTHSTEGKILRQNNTAASPDTLKQVITGQSSNEQIPMLNCGYEESYDNLARRCVSARRSLVFQTDHNSQPKQITFPVNSGNVEEFTLTVWIKFLSDTDYTSFLINLDDLAYIEVLRDNKIALDAHRRSKRLVEQTIPDYKWHITTISSIKSVFYIACIYSFSTELIGFNPGIQLSQNAHITSIIMNEVKITGQTKYQEMLALRRLEVYAYYLELNTIALFAYTSTNLSGEATPFKLWYMDESKESILYNSVNLADSFVIFDSEMFTWRPRLLSDREMKSIECIVEDGYYDYETNECYTDLNCVPTTYGNLCVTTIGVILICQDGYMKRGNSCELTCIDSTLRPSGNTCREAICGEYLKERDDCPGLPLLLEASLVSNSRIRILLSEQVDTIPTPYDPALISVSIAGPRKSYQFAVLGIELGAISGTGQYNKFFILMEITSTIRADEQVYFNIQILDKEMFFPRTLDDNTLKFSLRAQAQMNPQQAQELQFIEEIRQQLAQAIGSSVTTSVGFSLFLDASMKYLWALINASQLVQFTPLIKVPLPQNFKVLIKFIDFASGDVLYMKKLQEQLDQSQIFSSKQLGPLDATFEDFQYSTTSFLANYKMIIIIMILEATIILALLTIFLLLKACRCQKLSKIVGGCFGCAVVFRHYLQFSFQTFIICFIGLHSVQFSKWNIAFSTICLFIAAVSYVFIFILSLILLFKRREKLNSDDYSENWRLSELTKELNLKSRQTCRVIYYPFFIVHRALFAGALVFLRNHTQLQLDSIIVLSVLWMAYLLIGRPLRSFWQMVLQLIDAVTFIILMGMFMHLHFYGYQMTDEQNFKFGYTMILVFGVSFALNFITVAVVLVKSIFLFLSKCFCKKCFKKSKRKYELNQPEEEMNSHSMSTIPLEEDSQAVITQESPLKAQARKLAALRKKLAQPRPKTKQLN